jgi:hypothetical protein
MEGWKRKAPIDPMPMRAMKLDRLIEKAAICFRCHLSSRGTRTSVTQAQSQQKGRVKIPQCSLKSEQEMS